MSSKKIIMKPSPHQASPVKGKSNVEVKAKVVSPTKVIVRRLPPSLTAESFLDEVSPLPEHNYFSFVPADKSLGQYGFCRAVINFKKADDLFIFREQFDNYVFVDARGNEYPALVEYAPYQKAPLRPRKADHRENTLDNDSDFLKFVEALENPEVLPTMSIKEVLEEIDAKAKERLAAQNSETPLLAFINKFKVEKRRAQEKLREERRLRELEKKRLKEDERRLRRDRERREAADGSKNKDTISVKQLPSSNADRKTDAKKAVNKGETRPTPAVNKASTKYAGESKGPPSTKPSDRPGKYSSVTGTCSSKQNKDDIIVRTLPSAKYKSSKTAADKSRPSSSKPLSSQVKGTTSSSQPKTTAPTAPKNTGESEKRETSSQQKTSAIKPGVAVKSWPKQFDKPSPKSHSKLLPASTVDRSKPKDQKEEQDPKSATKTFSDKTCNKGSEKSPDSSVDELSGKTSSVKVKMEKSTAGSDSPKSETKRYTKSAPTSRLDRSTSEDSEAKSQDSMDVDGDKYKTARNTRYKDRPERAIYNPAARAAERRQRQQATSSADVKTSSSDNKVE